MLEKGNRLHFFQLNEWDAWIFSFAKLVGHQTGQLPNEDQKLDSLHPGSREMEEGGRWEGQNVQQLKKVQHLEEEEKLVGLLKITR